MLQFPKPEGMEASEGAFIKRSRPYHLDESGKALGIVPPRGGKGKTHNLVIQPILPTFAAAKRIQNNNQAQSE